MTCEVDKQVFLGFVDIEDGEYEIKNEDVSVNVIIDEYNVYIRWTVPDAWMLHYMRIAFENELCQVFAYETQIRYDEVMLPRVLLEKHAGKGQLLLDIGMFI